MHVRRPTETTYRRRTARRLLLICAAAVLALTTGITLATAAPAAGPWVPSPSRSGNYRIERRW